MKTSTMTLTKRLASRLTPVAIAITTILVLSPGSSLAQTLQTEAPAVASQPKTDADELPLSAPDAKWFFAKISKEDDSINLLYQVRRCRSASVRKELAVDPWNGKYSILELSGDRPCSRSIGAIIESHRILNRNVIVANDRSQLDEINKLAADANWKSKVDKNTLVFICPIKDR